MYREMRRKDRQMDPQEALTLLASAEYGLLSTVSEDGQPYGIPLSFVLWRDAVYFHCARTGQKLENIAYNDRVCFTVVGRTQPVYEGSYTTNFESALVYGRVTPVEGEDKDAALAALVEKYLPDHMDKLADNLSQMGKVTAVYRISMDHLTGKHRTPAVQHGS